MITILIPFLVKCDTYGCAVAAMGTCAQEELRSSHSATLVEIYEPTLPEGWTRTQWGAHRCPAHKELP